MVSVIVPIYNTEKYLAQCLDSICAQTYSDLEILCINDGSTDSSSAILAEYAAKDSRIQVINQKNSGYGAGCNNGLSHAQGEWISIVEPDDWIQQTMYEHMIAQADAAQKASPTDPAAEIVKASFYQINKWDNPKTQARGAFLPFERAKIPRTAQGDPKSFTIDECTTLIKYHPSIWSAIYRRDFLEKWHIRFPEIPGAGWADNPFMMETMCRARSIVYLDECVYNYRADLPGATKNHSSTVAIRRPFDRWLEMDKLLRDMGEQRLPVIEAFYYRAFTYVFGAIYDDGWDNPIVQEGIREVFSRMDVDIVAAERDIQPKRKRFFFKVRGLACPKINPVPWLLYAADNTISDVANGGALIRVYGLFDLVFGSY